MSEPQHNLSADPLAETDLLRIDGKIVLVSWWVYFLLQNLDALTKDDIERRLIAALGNRMPALRNGIYMTSTALIDPDYTFSDERMIMFSTATPCIACTRASTPGMCSRVSWDQNIRKPGYFMPRDAGKHYRSAWEILLCNRLRA